MNSKELNMSTITDSFCTNPILDLRCFYTFDRHFPLAAKNVDNNTPCSYKNVGSKMGLLVMTLIEVWRLPLLKFEWDGPYCPKNISHCYLRDR